MAILLQTTFDDTNFPTRRAVGRHWDQTIDGLGDSVVGPGVGDGFGTWGSWTTAAGSGDQILTAANNDAGGGGKGFRHWIGDGSNNAGGSMSLGWTPVSELYFRYYIRFPLGFHWGGGPNFKELYMEIVGSNGFYFGMHSGVIGGSNGANSWHSSMTWADSQGGGPDGDGLWHCKEIHIKMHTAGQTDGVFEMWYDGAQIFSDTATNFGSNASLTWEYTAVGENHGDPLNGVDLPVDFDDIVVATSYIGPLSGGGVLLPRMHTEGLFVGA